LVDAAEDDVAKWQEEEDIFLSIYLYIYYLYILSLSFEGKKELSLCVRACVVSLSYLSLLTMDDDDLLFKSALFL